MKDWPESLRVNAAAMDLASALYHARSQAFCLGALPFTDLPPSERRPYIEQAAALVRGLKPGSPSTPRPSLRMVRS